MKTGRIVIIILGLLGLLVFPGQLLAGLEEYILEFIPTQNGPPGIRGTMTIKVDVEKRSTKVEFKLSGAYPNTVYTLWTVFNLLKEPLPADGSEVPSIPALSRPAFPSEGNGVSPLARLDTGFTSRLGVDPGASFVTDHKGDNLAPPVHRRISTWRPGIDVGELRPERRPRQSLV